MCLSCRQVESNKEVAKKYFDINGLIDHQVAKLDAVSPLFLKTAVIDGAVENNQLSTNNLAAWTKELSIFKSIDINKPMLVDSYEVIETHITGVKTIIYISKFPNTTQVDSLAISFDEPGANPSEIHAHISGNNALFGSAKIIDLSFEKVKDQNMLSFFKIEGWQKMIVQDSSSYKIEGAFSY